MKPVFSSAIRVASKGTLSVMKGLRSPLIVMVALPLMISPPFLIWVYGSDAWRGGALVASTLNALGIVPLDVVRILGLLMAVHYVRHLPKILRNTRVRIEEAKGFSRKCFNGLGGIAELAVSVAVPVMFYAIFGGGGHDTVKIAVLSTIGA